MQETQIRSLGQEDSLEEEMACVCMHACACVRVCVCVCVCIVQLFNLIKCLLLSKVGHFLFRKILTKLKLFFLEQRIIKPTRDLIYPLIKHFKDLWKKVQKKQKIIIGFISGGFYY